MSEFNKNSDSPQWINAKEGENFICQCYHRGNYWKVKFDENDLTFALIRNNDQIAYRGYTLAPVKAAVETVQIPKK